MAKKFVANESSTTSLIRSCFIMLFVGIDIAKNKHDMAVIDSKGNILLKHLNFANSKEGFDKLHTKLMELASSHDSDICIALEDTEFMV